MTKEDYWSVPINYVRVPDTSGYPGDKALETVMRTVEKQGEVPELLHKAKGKSLPLAFYQEESGGTHRLFALIGDLAYASLFSWLAVIDEIEESLHPLLVHSLIAAHFTGVIPASTSQLLFTTHNPLLLDQTLLRRDQIWFTEKDQEGATRLYPLTDFKPRKDESLVKGYLAGRYGGIPFIPEGLKF